MSSHSKDVGLKLLDLGNICIGSLVFAKVLNDNLFGSTVVVPFGIGIFLILYGCGIIMILGGSGK